MKIYSVFDPEYRPYGKVLEDYDTLELTAAMQKIPMPGAGVSYEASIPALEGELAGLCASLTLTDETYPEEDVWARCGEDSLRGLFLQDLREQYAAADEEGKK